MVILKLFYELLPLLALGYLIGRYKPELSSQIAKPLINYGVPVSLMGLLLKSGLDWLLFQALVMALLVIGILIAAIRTLPKIRGHIGSSSLLLGSLFGNSGYFGIPVSLALLPTESLNFSIGYDLGATLLVWSLGPMLLSTSSQEQKKKANWKIFINALTSSPASKGLVGAMFVQLTPWNTQITSFLSIPSGIVIVLALMVVGIRLGAFEQADKPVKRDFRLLLQPSLLIKLIILPSLMLILSKALNLSDLMCNALVLQAATPTAISVLLLAEAYGQEQKIATSLVTYSTVMSLITIPFWFLFLQYII